MRLFNITRWPGVLVFLLAGLGAVGFAFVTVNLFSQAMANRKFIAEHGWLAVQSGALLQVAQLMFWGAIALLCWLIFKICEQELGARYMAWTQKTQKTKELAPTSDPKA